MNVTAEAPAVGEAHGVLSMNDTRDLTAHTVTVHVIGRAYTMPADPTLSDAQAFALAYDTISGVARSAAHDYRTAGY